MDFFFLLFLVCHNRQIKKKSLIIKNKYKKLDKITKGGHDRLVSHPWFI